MGNIIRKEVFIFLTVISRMVNCDADNFCFGEILFEHGFGVSAEGNVHAVVADIDKSCVAIFDSEFFKGFNECGRVGFLLILWKGERTDERGCAL